MTSPPTPSTAANPAQRILLVTGMLGAGKTTALRVLEDLGWEAIDNFPIRLLGRLLATPPSSGRDDPAADDHAPAAPTGAPLAIGFDSRTRGFDPEKIISQIKRLGTRDGVEISTLFLDCSGAELERRYNETRRRHPLAQERPLSAGIAQERELMAPLRRWADVVLSTTDFATNELQQAIRGQFGETTARMMTVTITSFGFAKGVPPLADLVFDMRFLDNPYWIADLRPQTGLDAPVANHIRSDPAFTPAFEAIKATLLTLLPFYAASARSYVNIAFGCTGGRHRSVFTTELMAEALRESGFAPIVLHRNLTSKPTDVVETVQTR